MIIFFKINFYYYYTLILSNKVEELYLALGDSKKSFNFFL